MIPNYQLSPDKKHVQCYCKNNHFHVIALSKMMHGYGGRCSCGADIYAKVKPVTRPQLPANFGFTREF